MSLTVQSVPTDVYISIFEDLEFKDFMNAMKVCKAWKEIIESNCFMSAIFSGNYIGNLVIDIPRDIFIDENLSAIGGQLLIRAKNIYGKPGVCLSGVKVTLVADQIRYLGSIEAGTSDTYCSRSYIRGPMPGGSSCSLTYYSSKPNFWSSLVSSHTR